MQAMSTPVSSAPDRRLFGLCLLTLGWSVLVLQAGADPVADPQGAKDFFDSVASRDKKLVVYPGMLHEILHEVERAKPIREAVDWLGSHASG